MDEARRSLRHRVLKSGSIRFGDVYPLRTAQPVAGRGRSRRRAGAAIPDHFTLIVHTENKIYSCAVVWRKEKTPRHRVLLNRTAR
jgi:hypothetical protein